MHSVTWKLAALAALTISACYTPRGSLRLDGSAVLEYDNVMPPSLVGGPLDAQARACGQAYNQSLRSGSKAAFASGSFKVMTAAGVGVAALAAGMAGTVEGPAAKRHWGYASLGAAAFIPLATGLDAWLNASENMAEQKAQAEIQLAHLYNAGYLLSCPTAFMDLELKTQQAIEATSQIDSKASRRLAEALGQFRKTGGLKALSDELDQAGKNLRQAVSQPGAVQPPGSAKAAAAAEASLAEARVAVQAAEKPEPRSSIPGLPPVASCLDGEAKQRKPLGTLMDEAQRDLIRCLARPVWSFGQAPSASQQQPQAQ